jgi:hypothetical protein
MGLPAEERETASRGLPEKLAEGHHIGILVLRGVIGSCEAVGVEGGRGE